jgi:hypothetical protein
VPIYIYKCEEGHEFEQLVQQLADADKYVVDSETRMCFHASDDPTVKLLESSGERLICGRTAYRQDDKSIPAKRASYHGIQQ